MNKRIHYFSGFLLILFICTHLLNHLISLAGVAQHISFMEKARVIYRHPAIETLLIAAVIIQIFSGASLLWQTRKRKRAFFDRLQWWSGLYLALFFLIHLGAVFSGRIILALDTNIYFGVAGLNTFPFNLFFIPYYGLAMMSFFAHLASIHFRKMNQTILGLSVPKQAILIMVVGLVLTIMIFFGLTNEFKGIAIPEPYQMLINLDL